MKNIVLILALTVGINATTGICKLVDVKEDRHNTIIGTKVVKVKYTKDSKRLYLKGETYTQSSTPQMYSGRDGTIHYIRKEEKILLYPDYGPIFYLYSECN